jgi:hypothetical protein
MEYKNIKNYKNYGDNNFFPSSMNVNLNNIHQLPFLFLQDHRKNYKNLAEDAIKGVQTKNSLNRLFFSDKNLKLIQKMLKTCIYKKTNGKVIIEDQDDTDLINIMRSVYFEYARNLPFDVKDQVVELNNIVLSKTVSTIITNIKQYYSYIRDITLPLNPLERPKNISRAGRKTLPSITSLF